MLRERQATIAEHALVAWDGETLDEINGNLTSAKTILHQIAGTAGSLGFDTLGTEARTCEAKIDEHLNGPDADLALCPAELIFLMDSFVQACDTLFDGLAQPVQG